MDVRKPKPIHSWREFLGEIGVIVIGITIALTGEQIVEAWHWRSEVAEVKETLNADVHEHLAQAAEQVAVGPCQMRQLRGLDEMVRQPGPLPRNLPAVTIALRSWSTNGWSIASSSGVVPHMSPQDRSDYSQNAEIVRLLGDYSNQQFLTLGEIHALRPSMTLSEDGRERTLVAIARAEQLSAVLQVASKQLLTSPIRSDPQHLSASEQAQIEQERHACEASTASLPEGLPPA